jgi:hypothetical protein
MSFKNDFNSLNHFNIFFTHIKWLSFRSCNGKINVQKNLRYFTTALSYKVILVIITLQWHLHYIQSETSHIPKKHFYLKTKKRNRVDKQNNNNTQINICGKRVVSLQQQQLFTWLMCSVFPVVLTSSKVELGILKFFFFKIERSDLLPYPLETQFGLSGKSIALKVPKSWIFFYIICWKSERKKLSNFIECNWKRSI